MRNPGTAKTLKDGSRHGVSKTRKENNMTPLTDAIIVVTKILEKNPPLSLKEINEKTKLPTAKYIGKSSLAKILELMHIIGVVKYSHGKGNHSPRKYRLFNHEFAEQLSVIKQRQNLTAAEDDYAKQLSNLLRLVTDWLDLRNKLESGN